MSTMYKTAVIYTTWYTLKALRDINRDNTHEHWSNDELEVFTECFLEAPLKNRLEVSKKERFN